LLQHALRLPHDLVAQRRDGDLVGAALEQLHFQLILELLDGDREGGLRNEAGFGSAPEVLFARDGDDVLQLR